MKNKNGFTLIEMLVCIAIIAALGVVVGLSANKVIGNARVNEYEDIINTVFNNAMIYSELSTSHCNLNIASNCVITLNDLVTSGLLDKEYYTKNNPMYEDKKFLSNDEVVIEKINGEKIATLNCSSNDTYDINSSKVEEYRYWGKC